MDTRKTRYADYKIQTDAEHAKCKLVCFNMPQTSCEDAGCTKSGKLKLFSLQRSKLEAACLLSFDSIVTVLLPIIIVLVLSNFENLKELCL